MTEKGINNIIIKKLYGKNLKKLMIKSDQLLWQHFKILNYLFTLMNTMEKNISSALKLRVYWLRIIRKLYIIYVCKLNKNDYSSNVIELSGHGPKWRWHIHTQTHTHQLIHTNIRRRLEQLERAGSCRPPAGKLELMPGPLPRIKDTRHRIASSLRHAFTNLSRRNAPFRLDEEDVKKILFQFSVS